MNVAYLCLGGNLYDREANLAEAQVRIAGLIGEVEKASRLYESDAWGVQGMPKYLNQVLKVSTKLTAIELLFQCLEIEKQMGRARTEKWENRLIDIDILFYNDEVMDTEMLKIPHPLMQDRLFVLIPLNEIAPEMIHPVSKKTVSALLGECHDRLAVTKYD